MITIWKFILDPHNLKLEMPVAAEILSVQAQHDNICLWAKVDPTAEKIARHFDVFGTGSTETPDDPIGTFRRYVGTVMLDQGSLVFHIYERLVHHGRKI